MSTKKMTTSSLAAAAAVVMGLVAAPAGAALVTEWDYEVTLEWITSGDDEPTFTGGDGTQKTTSSDLSWGAEDGDMTDDGVGIHDSRSGLRINDSGIEGSVLTGAEDFEDTVSITHYNNRLYAGFATLESAWLKTNLSLTPKVPANDAGNFPNDFDETPLDLGLSFSINFIETINTSEEEDCGFDVNSNCDDIFLVEFEALQDTFTFGGETYRTLVGSEFDFLDESICDAASVPDGCFGLTTTEGGSDEKGFGFRVEHVVPTPGVLALFGSGLLALGAAVGHRRREDEE